MESNDIKIGLLATLVGPFEGLGQEGVRGARLALEECGYKVAGKPIKVLETSTNATPDYALVMTEQLVERDGVDVVVGPLSGNEGLAVRDYARTMPHITFINGSSGAQDLMLYRPAPNFFNFYATGVQAVAGLGRYAVERGYRRVVTIGEDYSFPYAQIGGFTVDFCRAGGEIARNVWVPLGMNDYRMLIANMPTDVDAVLCALGGRDTINFVAQYAAAGHSAPLIGATITGDQVTIAPSAEYKDLLTGMLSASAVSDLNDRPAWVAFRDAYRACYPNALPSPSFFALGYYTNMKATLLALEAVGGDLSNGQQALQAALAGLKFEAPNGQVWLDSHHQALTTIYVNEVVKGQDGKLYTQPVAIEEGVDQMLGLPEARFMQLGIFSRDNPTCAKLAALP